MYKGFLFLPFLPFASGWQLLKMNLTMCTLKKMRKTQMMTMTYKSSLTKLSIQIQPMGSCFSYISPNIQRLYRRYGSSLIMLDATYRTTKHALLLFFKVVKTNVNYQVRHRLFYHGTHIIHVHFPSSIYQCFLRGMYTTSN